MLESFFHSLRYYNTIIELAKLTDDDLKHLNLSRSDIIHTALKQYWKANGSSSQALK
jgi:uncharacterized protein YjiS (DUF1127 family)